MNILKTIKFMMLIGCMGLLMPSSEASNSGLKVIRKPNTAGIPVLKPIRKTARTGNMKELPFVETISAPNPTAAEMVRGYILFAQPITRPFHKTTRPRPQERITQLNGFAAQGEYEPLHFGIYPLRNLKNFRVIVSNLTSADGYTIRESNIDIRLGTYWKIRYPRYVSKHNYREQQELLEKVTVADFPKNETQRYFIDIHVPVDCPAGLYQGTVTLFDDTVKKAIELPIKFKVFGYQLKRDPDKHLSVFYYPPHIILSKYKGKLFDKALTADLSNMQKFGIDLAPTVYISLNHVKADEFKFIIPQDSLKVMDKIKELKFKGPIYLALSSTSIKKLYKHFVPSGKMGSHAGFTEEPKNDRIFVALENASKAFVVENRRKGYPAFIICPIDEPRALGIDLTAKIFAAIRRGGMKTIVTNDPTSGYSNAFRKYSALDAWDSQAFAMPYDKLIKDKNYQYWCYPNHNSGEIRDMVVMQKGGRMTYGFGFWKSGYQVLNPWAWRFFPGGKNSGKQFNYLLHERVSGCGNRLDKKGNFIPAINWLCFREGYDDGRYIYTLQQAMAERMGSDNIKCQALIKQGKLLLDEIWQRILTKRKYLKVDFLADESFNRIRWRLALLTDELLKYPGKSGIIAPSVMATAGKNTCVKDDAYYIQKGLNNGSIEYFNLAKNSFKGWKKSGDKEIKLAVVKDENGQDVLQVIVNVDHSVDGLHEDGDYPIGWPLVTYNFANAKIKLTNYDFLYLKYKFDSNRDAVADDITNIYIGFKAAKSLGEKIDLGGAERTWSSIQLPLKGKKYKSAYALFLMPAENYYPDKTKIVFSISDIGFIKFKHPFIKAISSVKAILISDRKIDVGISGYALNKAIKQHCLYKVQLLKNHQIIAEVSVPLDNSFKVSLPLKNLTVGNAELKVELYDANQKLQASATQKVNIIQGY